VERDLGGESRWVTRMVTDDTSCTRFSYTNRMTRPKASRGTKLRMTELGCGENGNDYEHQQHNQLGNLEARLGLSGASALHARMRRKKLHH
jgi:hypothetical protein